MGSNVLLTGGNFCIPNVVERFTREYRQSMPDAHDCRVHLPVRRVGGAGSGNTADAMEQEQEEDGVYVCNDEYSWQGAARYARSEVMPHLSQALGGSSSTRKAAHPSFVTRQEYLEWGHHYCNEKLQAW